MVGGQGAVREIGGVPGSEALDGGGDSSSDAESGSGSNEEPCRRHFPGCKATPVG